MLLALTVVPALAFGAGIPGKIAFVGLDHQIYVVDANGGEPKVLTRGDTGHLTERLSAPVPVSAVQGAPQGRAERRFAWPTWSPDGQTLLAQGVTLAVGGVTEQAGVYRLDTARPGVITPLYENREHGPIYLYVAPTGREAGVLVSQGGILGLGLVRISDGQFRALGLGFPFYFSWRSDGDAIVTHTGAIPDEGHAAEINLIDVPSARDGGKPQVTKLSSQPVLFRAPAWSPDGNHVAYAVRPEPGKSATLIVRAKNGEERKLASVSSRLVFSWSPDSKTIAVADATTPDSLFFGGINLI
ncbi:MAG: hypothetical protein ACREQQ_17520, partial [Candidatus Binatia bacterium]